MNNEALCRNMIFAHEGGFVNHPLDPGGATNMGITLRTLRSVRPSSGVDDLRRLTEAQAWEIYRRNYLDKIRFDELPDALALVVADWAVNSGPSRAARALQAELGVTADGAIGPVTLRAIGQRHPLHLASMVSWRRYSFVSRLGAAKWRAFGKGWTRRIKETHAIACRAHDRGKNEFLANSACGGVCRALNP